jgi:hypothetical protein
LKNLANTCFTIGIQSGTCTVRKAECEIRITIVFKITGKKQDKLPLEAGNKLTGNLVDLDTSSLRLNVARGRKI